MSEFKVEVVTIGAITKHENADTLSIADVNGYPVIIRTGEYAEGGRAVYLPIDSIVPADDPRWDFLGGHRRIKAKKLRGVFSMGMLTAADPAWPVGADVREALRIEKYDPDLAAERGSTRGPCLDDQPGPTSLPVYDIEGLRKYRDVLVPGEEVWISEKVHGQNARFVVDSDGFHIGSRTRFKKHDSATAWAKVAKRYDLAARLAAYPGIAIYGETYGNNSDMRYGVDPAKEGSDRLALFDVLDTKTRRWFDVDEFLAFAAALGLPTVPTLYRGPWDPEMAKSLAEGPTTIGGAAHTREGIVVKPVKDRDDRRVGRVLLKLHGEGYLLRKGA